MPSHAPGVPRQAPNGALASTFHLVNALVRVRLLSDPGTHCVKFTHANTSFYLMTEAGIDRVLTLDLHAGQIQGFFDIPVDNLYAGPIALQYFKYKDLVNPVVVSPDAGGVYRAKTFKEGLVSVGVEAQMAMIIKQRKAAGVIGTMDLVGHVKVPPHTPTASRFCANLLG